MTEPFAFHPDLKVARILPRAVVTRRSYPLVAPLFRLAARLTRTKAQTVRRPGGRRILLTRPDTDAPAPALMWIHGGGLVIGAPELDMALTARLTQGLDVMVAAPDYRLAPKHPYPAALEDLHAALCWLAEQPGVDPARIAIGGDSAGGGLAACLALHSAQRPGPRPCYLLLHEPMLDEATRRKSYPAPAQLRMWNESANRFGWGAYLAGVTEPVPATASAARATDAEVAGLPPTWLGVGTIDLFHDETVAFADRLRAAGKLAGLVTVPGAFHGFASVAPKAPVTQDYMAAMGMALVDGLRIGAG